MISVLYDLKNRISAFIFLEDTFIQAESHTQCIIDIFIQEEIVKDSKDFQKQMKNPISKNYLNHLIQEVENNSVFGELSIYKGKLSIIVFDKLNRFGLESIKSVSKSTFGDLPIYYLNLNNKNRSITELF